MVEKLNQYFAGRSSTAKSVFPHLHRVLSYTETKEYINWSCKQSSHHRNFAETLHGIVQQVDFDTFDEALAALGYEYYRLACLPKLNESDSQRMLLILSFAEMDVTLSHLINAIDASLAAPDSNSNFTSDNNVI